MKPVRIVIIAKAPVPGFAKTRLIPALGEDGAAQLARRMLETVVHAALDAQVGTVEMCVTPGLLAFDWKSLGLPKAVIWSDQGGGDLGARMGRVAMRATDDHEALLLIGTDCPGLGSEQLQAAAVALQTFDACMVPAVDGGYALLGLNRFHASLFDNIAWSTDAVARETLRRLDQLDWQVHLQGEVHDIDEPQDLQWLPCQWKADWPVLDGMPETTKS